MSVRCLIAKLSRSLGRHKRGAEGSVTVEAVLVLPLLIWWIFASYQFFVAFSEKSLNIKAAYTIADVITREQTPVNAAYINGLHTLFDRLTDTANPTWIRVTQIRADPVLDEIFLADWSVATGGQIVHTNATLELIKAKIPLMSKGDYVVLVETFAQFRPIFDVGLGAMTFDQFVVMRPRFLSKVSFQS